MLKINDLINVILVSLLSYPPLAFWLLTLSIYLFAGWRLDKTFSNWISPVNIGQVRRNRGWGGGLGRWSLPQIFDKFYFLKIEKKVLKWKIIQNYKTSRNSSKFIDIYNIIIDLDMRDGILSVIHDERFHPS